MRNKKLVKRGILIKRGRGFLDSLIPAAVNFATDLNSAYNVGSVVKDAIVTGVNIKKTVDNIKEAHNLSKAKEDIKRLNATELLNKLYQD